MKRVLKWDVPVDDHHHPIGDGPVLHVACQHDPESVQVWTEQHDDRVPVRTVQVFATGQPLTEPSKHLGTALSASGALVWHVYELTT